MSAISATHLPKFLSFAHDLLRWGGLQGEETAFLPDELSKADFWGFLLQEDRAEFDDHEAWCIRYGCLMALLCDEADRVSDNWNLGVVVDPELLRLGEDVSWIKENRALREAVLDAARNPRDTTINSVIRQTFLPWWSEVSSKWSDTASGA